MGRNLRSVTWLERAKGSLSALCLTRQFSSSPLSCVGRSSTRKILWFKTSLVSDARNLVVTPAFTCFFMGFLFAGSTDLLVHCLEARARLLGGPNPRTGSRATRAAHSCLHAVYTLIAPRSPLGLAVARCGNGAAVIRGDSGHSRIQQPGI